MNTYDSVEYPNSSYKVTSPESLSAIAKVFGVSSPDISKAKILELGCASGGNIIPLAERFPEIDVLGIDLSEKQINKAENIKKSLGLNNIKFEQKSILDLDFKDQKFDYIIAHGLYSWVPKEVKDKILEICGNNLSENGIAYVSYNTLPGWNALKTVRDMMLYHSNNFDDNSKKISESCNILKFVSDNIKDEKSTYKKSLDQEIELLKNVNSTSYLFHDHLETNNDPCYFHEFMDAASKKGLKYLGDSFLSSMYLGNHTEVVGKTLGEINDIVRQEQYMDFISNRRFRSTLLVNKNVEINRNISPSSFDGLRFSSNFVAINTETKEGEKEISSIDLALFDNKEATAKVKGKEICACYIEVLKAAPLLLTSEEIIEAAHKTTGFDLEKIKAEFNANILKLVFGGLFSVTSGDLQYVKEISDKPGVKDSVRLEALTANMITNMRHENVNILDYQRVMIQYLDSKNTKSDIVKAIKSHVEKGELEIKVNDQLLKVDNDNIDEILSKYVNENLEYFSRNSLLVS